MCLRNSQKYFWFKAKDVDRKDPSLEVWCIEVRAGLTPDQIVEIEQTLAIERYVNLCVGNAVGLGVSLELNDEKIARELPDLLAGYVQTFIQDDEKRLEKSIQRARSRLHFVS